MLNIGDILETNCGFGPVRVKEVIRGCTCRGPSGFPSSRPHIHLIVGSIDGSATLLLPGGYDEATLWCIWDNTRLRVIPPDDSPQGILF